MIHSFNDGLGYFQFELFERRAELWHAVFGRRGGVSTGAFHSLNVGRNVGDQAANVQRNRLRIARCAGAGQLVFARQQHGVRIRVLEAETLRQKGGERWPTLAGDGLLTAVSGAFLVIQVADCQAIMLYDPVKRVVGNVHAGWRGSVGNIAGAAVTAMRDRYGCLPADILAGVGPSLGPCCAEFVNYRREIPRQFWKYRTEGDRFDFWAISRDQLIEAGLSPFNIELSRRCTRCDSRRFYSYRRDPKTGRFAAVIGLRGDFGPRRRLPAGGMR